VNLSHCLSGSIMGEFGAMIARMKFFYRDISILLVTLLRP
jgi:hypothetical protein